MARPGVTLIDPATEDALTDPERYVLRHLRPAAARAGMIRAT